MGINELITILKNRLDYLALHRKAAHARGDMDSIATLDEDIATSTATLTTLQELQAPAAAV